MRIIAGEWRGRHIVAPSGREVRPTADRVREAVLGSIGTAIAGANVLDVFGGSGALGFEAASRGAAHVVIIEKNQRAQEIIKENLALLGSPSNIRIICSPYEKAMRTLSKLMKFDIFFLDPPYASRQYIPCIEAVRSNGIASPGAIFVLESSKELDLELQGFEITKRKKYGSVHIAFGGFV